MGCSSSPAPTWPIPGPALRRARAELAATSLAGLEAVAVSAVTGAGLPELRQALAQLARDAPRPGPGRAGPALGGPGVQRRGSGTVVTGTLPAGPCAPAGNCS